LHGSPTIANVTQATAGTSRRLAFWFLALLLGLFLAAASAPSPLYPIYQLEWQFAPSTLTAVYAVYAFGALGALLVTGRVSDHVGRRRVVAIGLVIQLSAMAVFVAATGVQALFVARVLQGVATGMAAGAISAWLLDLEPPNRPRLGSLIGGVALVGGLGVGALASGLLVDKAPYPLHLVYWLFGAAYLLGLLALPAMPDVVARTPGWQRSLRPQIGVPAAARLEFLTTAPSMVALWAVGGFYLALGPSLAISLIGAANHVAGGAVIAALMVTAAAASYLAGRAEPRRALVRGSCLLMIGVALSLLAVAAGSFGGLLIGSAISGVGFGPAFSAILRTLLPLAPADRRAALLAAIYVEVYLSFSLPTIAAGFAAGIVGLAETAYAYGAVAIALAAITMVALMRRTVDRSD
jgi:MFS family permease